MSNIRRVLMRLVSAVAFCLLLAPVHAAVAITVITDAGTQPESITAAPDGGLILGSSTKPTIYRAAKGETKAKPWIDVSADGAVMFLGVLSDVSTNTLWACEIGPRGAPGTASPSALLSFDLSSGARKSRWKLPGDSSLCNDFSIGPDHALYVSDTLNSTIYRVRPGATAGEVAHVTVIRTGLKRPTAIEPAGKVLWVGDRANDNAISIPLPH
jgi:hypothetical protein